MNSPSPNNAPPAYWPAALDDVTELLRRSGAEVKQIGISAGGRAIHGVTIGPAKPRLSMGVIGGTHGHEPGTVAAAMNLLSAAASGTDLLGDPAAEIIRAVRWVIVPVLNPDGRARCPAGFAGRAFHEMNRYCQGWDTAGDLVPRANQLPHLASLAQVGGLYNDAGVDILNATDGTLPGTAAVEAAAVARFLGETGCDVVLDLHAHAFDPMFYTPIAGLPERVAARGHAIAEQVRAQASRAGWRFAAPECVASGREQKVPLPTAALYHNLTGAIPFLFEGSQGCSGVYRATYGGKECDIRDPGYGYDQIIRCYLYTIGEVAQSFAEHRQLAARLPNPAPDSRP